jgi:hypothetical protein
VSILAEEELGAGGANELTHGFASMAAEIVQDHDIAGTKRRRKDLLHIGPKALAVDRPLDKPRRIDPVMAQCRQEVMVFQRPWGTLAVNLWPRAAHPRKGAMSVRVQVSSMKTSRSGSTRS